MIVLTKSKLILLLVVFALLKTINSFAQSPAASFADTQKIGPSFYASVIKNGDERRIALLPRWAVIDLSKKRQYVFKDSSYEAMYQRLIDTNYR